MSVRLPSCLRVSGCFNAGLLERFRAFVLEFEHLCRKFYWGLDVGTVRSMIPSVDVDLILCSPFTIHLHGIVQGEDARALLTSEELFTQTDGLRSLTPESGSARSQGRSAVLASCLPRMPRARLSFV